MVTPHDRANRDRACHDRACYDVPTAHNILISQTVSIYTVDIFTRNMYYKTGCSYSLFSLYTYGANTLKKH